ncbi:MAG: pyruvate carboxylase [Saprospiraceae bacterium]|nr:pyruvate carboxylase [Saprospiraceae bacterium]
MTSIRHNRYKKLLVANRGEIAIRVLRAASELKLRTVAIFTYEDRYSLHRYKADESYQIGKENEPLKPYLDVEAIIKVAKQHGVDAIHPGYGFLSENVDFVRRCDEEGIVFVGPTAKAMERLGDKVKAKIIADEVNVPTIADSKVDLSSQEKVLEEADRIGYPIVVKAAAGGGGRGMRVVRNPENLFEAYEEAKGEAKTAFGDETVFLEKFIDNPKHIEVQILGDKYGHIVHLFERDCSVQRRFQKVVEVAPNDTLSKETKEKMYQYALKIAQHVEYVNAGTVEFLVDADENIYFIEVNPRVQVEHTITEEITGVDIVRSQILISMGYELSHPTIFIRSQDDVQIKGYAVQCRVTTEDPLNDFKPDYGTLIAYRSASGFGIRLDAGSAFPGSEISPFFDSLLVKVTAWGRTHKGACERLHRALSEFRIRGVKTNVGFLMNLLEDETFRSGKATVNYISEHPHLLTSPRRRDRGTKLLKYLANVIVNGNPDVKKKVEEKLTTPKVPPHNGTQSMPYGSKDRLTDLGRDKFVSWLKEEKPIHYTDTTFRDAHQSLLATRMRTDDMLRVAESYAHHHGGDLFSMEVWGGATFDVAMRFLNEDPWQRLRSLRASMPNVLLQMLLRGSNGVGYKAYPDNLIESFIVRSAENGIDVFRIFDSLNWVENLKTSIRVVREQTSSLAEACICYTGDVSDPSKTKYDLAYYLDLAKALEDEGAHMLAIKDMAGLLKPQAATMLIEALKETIDIPIHLHTHDTSSIQSATYLKAVEAGVDVIDLSISSLSGLTAQPSLNGMVAMLKGHERENKLDLISLNHFADYWEDVRKYYQPFETELRSGTASVYEHEIPGGQYSNLRPQARGLGLEGQFEKIKENYQLANELFGDLVKVTPSSKVVGDMAMFMTSNKLTKDDVLAKANDLSFPDSVKSLFRGELGQPYGGFPKELQKAVLKNEVPFSERPNSKLEPIDLDKTFQSFQSKFGKYVDYDDFLSHQLYPKVFEDFYTHHETYGEVWTLPTPSFFYGLKENEEILVEIAQGKNLLIEFVNRSNPNDAGEVDVFFKLNGQSRVISVVDHSSEVKKVARRKAETRTQIGSPLQGSLSTMLVKEGQHVAENDPLFIIEAMKMESTISAPMSGEIKKIHLFPKELVNQDDLILEIDPDKELI